MGEVIGIVVDPVSDTLMVNIQQTADVAQAVPFQMKCQSLQPYLFIIATIFRLGSVATATRFTTAALAAGWGKAILYLVFLDQAFRASHGDSEHG